MDQIIRIPFPDPIAEGARTPRQGQPAGEALRPFFVGPENRLVEPAVRAVLEESIPKYSPLVLAGASGTGKSHLAEGLAAAYRVQYPARGVICLTAVDFARRLADAIDTQATDAFRRRYRSARLLVVEDVVRLADYELAQHELVRTLDALEAAGHQVIVTSPSPPGRWVRIHTALQSRLEAGLCVTLVAPGQETRLALLREAAHCRGLYVSEAVAEVLVDGTPGGARELIAALLVLHAARQTTGKMPDVASARAYVAECNGHPTVELRQIARLTARALALPLGQLRGRSQRREAVLARGVAVYLARRMTDLSLEQIGAYFGGRDHTTVLHSCRKTEKLLETEPLIQEAVEQVQRDLAVKSAAHEKHSMAAV